MPNWCFQSVAVTANTREELVEFFDFCDKPHTSHFQDWQTKEFIVNENAKGVFWNFKAPTDLATYFGDVSLAPKTNTSNPDGTFNNDLFMAEFVRAMLEDEDWYHWNVRNWGTKWDIELENKDSIIDEIQELNDGTFSTYWNFSTAWSPAIEALNLIAERFPNLTFDVSYEEEGMCFAGRLHYNNGELVTDISFDDPQHEDFNELEIPCWACGQWGEPECLAVDCEPCGYKHLPEDCTSTPEYQEQLEKMRAEYLAQTPSEN